MNTIKRKLKSAMSLEHEIDAASRIPNISKDVYQYRFHHGVNLGGVFVLERWLFGGMFDKTAEGGSELDAVKASVATRGLQFTKEKWEAHWLNALLSKDIDFLVNEAHCNTVRLPIGYFTLGQDFCSGTPFEGQVAEVYQNAWQHVLNICKKLAAVGIGVIIDMHALPGGANKDSHSGTSSRLAGLWDDSHNLDLAQRCLCFIAKEISLGQIQNCAGLQLCNEACWEAKGMYDFYSQTISEISKIHSSIPIYISDAWNLRLAIEWTQKQNTIASTTNLIVIDTHKYYTFDEKHKSKSPQEIIRVVPEALSACNASAGNVYEHGAAPVFIGEYSCVMDTRSWSRVSEDEKEELTQQFGHVQSQQWHMQSCGSAFWTLNMTWMPGGGWGFVAQTRKGNIRAPNYMSFEWTEIETRVSQADAERSRIRSHEAGLHLHYWNKSNPEQASELYRFEAGWDDGWNDALAFFTMRRSAGLGVRGGDRIGCLDGWIRKRMTESGNVDSMSWKYEHGYRNAVAKAEEILFAGAGQNS